MPCVSGGQRALAPRHAVTLTMTSLFCFHCISYIYFVAFLGWPAYFVAVCVNIRQTVAQAGLSPSVRQLPLWRATYRCVPSS